MIRLSDDPDATLELRPRHCQGTSGPSLPASLARIPGTRPCSANTTRFDELTSPPLDFLVQVGRSSKTAKGKERACEYPLNYYVGEQGAVLTVLKRTDEETDLRRHVLPGTPDVFHEELCELARTR